jgi:general secretion pathway protein G
MSILWPRARGSTASRTGNGEQRDDTRAARLPFLVGNFTPSVAATRRIAPICFRSSVLGSGAAKQSAFTLIELIIVLAILALLITIAVPRYFSHIERTKEATLKQDLVIMRDAIDKFHGDKGRYPESLEELVTLRYIRSVPLDPITESAGTWKLVPPTDSDAKGAVYDVKSGAEGKGLDGKPFADW